eukprot:6440031-Prymnesium_polylepis.1
MRWRVPRDTRKKCGPKVRSRGGVRGWRPKEVEGGSSAHLLVGVTVGVGMQPALVTSPDPFEVRFTQPDAHAFKGAAWRVQEGVAGWERGCR